MLNMCVPHIYTCHTYINVHDVHVHVVASVRMCEMWLLLSLSLTLCVLTLIIVCVRSAARGVVGSGGRQGGYSLPFAHIYITYHINHHYTATRPVQPQANHGTLIPTPLSIAAVGASGAAAKRAEPCTSGKSLQ